jgi:ribose/xylose/arabinose/galactoside ABC-type transport system permease subunit
MNKILGILLLLVFVCVGTTLLTEAFVKPFNMQNIVRHSALYGVIGVGVALVIITGGIDLSIGSVIGLVGCVLPMLLVERGWSVPASLGAVMLMSLVIGLAHGLLITKLRLQPFIVTLCGLLVYRGLARWITSDQTKGFGSEFNDSLRLLAIGKPCSVAFLAMLVGVGVTVWSAWRWVSHWRHRRTQLPSLQPEVGESPGWIGNPSCAVGVLLGVLLIVIGLSRFWFGYRIDVGIPLVSLGPLTVPSWRATVVPQGEQMPQMLMHYSGWGAIFLGLPWLAVVLVRGRVQAMLLPLAALGTTAGLVWAARGLVDQPDEWFWLGADWARTWRIVGVFSALGLLMASLAWFGRRAMRVAGEKAVPPLVLTAACAVLWLLGQTPLGRTLVPTPLIVLALMAIAASIFLNQTIYGRYLLALGNNEEAARFSGINTDRMIILAYALCSLAAGLGGILFALDTNSIQPASHGSFYELYAIAAAVLGGCSLRGGEGTILGVVIGAAVMRVLYNSINLIGIPSQLEFAIIGLVILMGVIADEVVKRITSRQREE